MYKSQKDKDEAIRISEIFQAFAVDNGHLQYEREGDYSGETVWQTYFPSIENIIRDLYNNINIRITPKKCVPSTSTNPKDKDLEDEQQKAKELAKLLTAFTDGKQLEYYNDIDEVWCRYNITCLCSFLDAFANNKRKYRIKPKTKREPLNQQDLIDRELSGKTMRVRKADSDFDSVLITLISKIGIAVYDCQQIITYEELKENFYWLDGTPCSKEVEDE